MDTSKMFKVIAGTRKDDRKYVSFHENHEDAEKFCKTLWENRALFEDSIVLIRLIKGGQEWQHWKS